MWARLLKYVFDQDLECPRCGSQMEIISFILDGPTIRKILRSVGLSTDSPAPVPAHTGSDPDRDLAA